MIMGKIINLNIVLNKNSGVENIFIKLESNLQNI